MENNLWLRVLSLTTILVLFLHCRSGQCTSVMGIDLGSEWMKVAIASPGSPIKIALNTIAQRKTPSAIAFLNGERTFGKDALFVGTRSPSNCYVYFLDLLGKKIDNPVVDLYKKRFPHYNIIPDPKRNTVLFKHADTDEQFSPEELVAMMLEKAREFAQDSAGQIINEAVIAVPGFFGQAERTAMLRAAEIAGIKVSQLINSYTAAALNYGMYHTKSFKELPTYMMVYDMGAYSTQASVVSYQLIKSKDTMAYKLQPQLNILGVGYERNMSNLEIQIRLRDYLAAKFNSLKLTSNDVTKNPQSMAKLFKEAGQLKDSLNIDTDQFVKIKGLIDEKDMFIKVSREELIELCEDVFDKVALLGQRALEASGLTIGQIEQVVLTGGSSRVYRVKDRLIKDLKSSRPLGESFNVDEAIAFGAAYKAADLSDEFEIKPFITMDAILFPTQLTFNKEVAVGKNPTKQVKFILFSYMSPYPRQKTIKFNEHQRDFNFTVSYSQLNHLDENEIKCLGSLSLNVFKLSGVQEAYSKYQGKKNVNFKGINVRFTINDSGLLVLQNVELLFEKVVVNNQNKQSTIMSVRNSINNNSFKDVKDTSKLEQLIHGTPEDLRITSHFYSNTQLKVTIVKETIDVNQENLFVTPSQGDDFQNSITKLKEFKEKDMAQLRKEKSLHNLITSVIEAHEKLEKPEFANIATELEIRSILNKCTEISNWLGYDGLDAPAEVLDSKLYDLRKITKPVWERNIEYTERPSRLESLNNALNSSKSFLENIKNFSLEETPFTQEDIQIFEKLISDITTWRDEQIKKQEKLPKFVDPVLKIQAIAKKHSLIDREMKYFMNKFTSWKPKKTHKSKDENKDYQHIEL